MEDLIKRLKELEERHRAPNSQEYQGLSLKAVKTVAREFIFFWVLANSKTSREESILPFHPEPPAHVH